jgi:hypothetical protein
MKHVLAALVLTAIAAAPVTAKTVHGVIVSDDGRMVKVLNGNGRYFAPPRRDKGLGVIFSNVAVKYPQGLYFCCSGATIAGPDSALGFQTWPALQFTPTTNAAIKEVDVPVQEIAGTVQVDFGIYTDEGGLPGKLLKKFKATGYGVTGTCCGLAVGKDRKGIPVVAGTPYWVAITTDTKSSDAFANWPFNSTDQLAHVPSAVNKGAGWQSNGDAFPAMSVAVYGN